MQSIRDWNGNVSLDAVEKTGFVVELDRSHLRLSRATIVMSTPYLDEAERCSRIAFLHNGQLLALDHPDALRQTLPGKLFEVIAPDHRRAAAVLRSLPAVASVQTFGERAHVRLEKPPADAVDLLARELRGAGIEVTAVRQVPPSLEDVFVTRLGEMQS